jgi:hypothetical protein
MYSTIPIHWNIKSAPASQDRSRAGPALYVFSLLAHDIPYSTPALSPMLSCYTPWQICFRLSCHLHSKTESWMNFSLSMLGMTEPWRKCSLIQLSFALYIKPEFCRVALNCALICRFRQCILRKVLLLKSFCHTYLIVGKRFMVESFKVCSKRRCHIQYLVLVNSDRIVPKNYGTDVNYVRTRTMDEKFSKWAVTEAYSRSWWSSKNKLSLAVWDGVLHSGLLLHAA